MLSNRNIVILSEYLLTLPDYLKLIVNPPPSALTAGEKIAALCSNIKSNHTVILTCPGNHTLRGQHIVRMANIEVTQEMDGGVCKCEVDTEKVQKNMYLVPDTIQLEVSCKYHIS